MKRMMKTSDTSESANAARTTQAKFTSWSRESEQASRVDNSPAMTAQRRKLDGLFGSAIQRVEEEEPLQGKFEAMQRVEEEEPLQGKFEAASAVQRKEEAAKPNNTGLPDNLKSGIESLSGMSMDSVKVHYNSSQPAQLNALAYAQGSDIHVAPGQEQHLPHEAWHVVQQAQGRVKPTMQMKEGVPVNDDHSLEHEADVMGAKAMQRQAAEEGVVQNKHELGQEEFLPGQFGVQQHKGSDEEPLQGKFNISGTVQPLMDKMKVDKPTYMKKTMSTVYLYAEFDGTPLGIFSTTSGKHAEENLIAEIERLNLGNGTLVVYLSTSPCSSCFGTREDGQSGCQERLEGLASRGIRVVVHADHLYQPKNTGQMEREIGMPTGFSSLSSAYSSPFEMDFSRLPKKLHDSEMIDDVTGQPVAQLNAGKSA